MKIFTSIIKGTRKYQQDSICIPNDQTNERGLIVALCDGMGGMDNGDLASNLCADLIVNTFYSKKTVINNIPEYYEEISRISDLKVSEIGIQGNGVGTCGTTLVSACVKNKKLYVCSIGDSNIFFIRNNLLTKLNIYHNVYEKMKVELHNQTITQEYFNNYPDKHALTSYIGMNGLKYIDKNLSPIPLFPEDKIILCSDGISGVLSNEEINNICSNNDPSFICQALTNTVQNKNLTQLDNASVLLLYV